MADRSEPLDVTERWFADLYRYVDPPGFIMSVQIDMSRSRELIALARESGLRITWSHMVLRAVGLSLHRLGDLHCLVEHDRRLIPDTVDASIPVGGAGVKFAPATVVLRDIGRMPLPAVAAEMTEKSAAARASEPADFSKLRKAAFLLNRRWVRAWLIPSFLRSAKWRRQHMGTVLVSFLKDVEFFVPLTPYPGLVVAAGQVRDGVVVENGEMCVRPVMALSCCVDHKVWDGLTASQFMTEVKRILTSGELEGELSGSLPAATTRVQHSAPFSSQ